MKYYTLVLGFLLLCFGAFTHFEIDSVEAGFVDEAGYEWTGVLYCDFEPSYGDYFMVDVSNGNGYLINNFTRTYTVFPVMTGASGMSTPYRDWVVLEENIQPNRIIFSKSGEFFRMYIDGTKRTSYGIHGYGYFDYEMRRGTKFLSWGCILVADDVLDVIEESYIANGNALNVSTRESIDILSYLEGV